LIQRDSGAGGLMVYVQDAQGLTHAYMHLGGTQPGLTVGQQVNRGDPIAMMGDSGTEGSPHLHYEVRKNAATGDPLNQLIDPRPYVAGTGSTPGESPLGQALTTARTVTTAALSGGGQLSGQIS
jgi:murein DD-endopeptidase MepM/ murein hydrolase activator NlpD